MLPATPLAADVFRYRDGRVISGTVINEREQKPDPSAAAMTIWTVEVEAGVYVQITEPELVRNGHEKHSDDELAYLASLKNAPPKTAEDHIQRAAECVRLGLTSLADAHYRRVLDLEPQHENALLALGFTKNDNNRWVKKEEEYGERRGKVFYKGRWRFPESVAIEQADEEFDAKLAPLKKQLSLWRRDLTAGRGASQERAFVGMQSLQDPLAVGIISEYLLDARKPAPTPLKMLYVSVLARFEIPASAQTLSTVAIVDSDEQVRNACLDAVRRFAEPVAVPIFIGFLGHPTNDYVNRAADGLSQFRSQAAILPLINALNTEHVQSTVPGAGMNVNMQGGLSFGGGAKEVKVPFQNSSVYGTLTQLTGQNLGYNEEQWLAWYASIYGAPAKDLRRDL